MDTSPKMNGQQVIKRCAWLVTRETTQPFKDKDAEKLVPTRYGWGHEMATGNLESTGFISENIKCKFSKFCRRQSTPTYLHKKNGKHSPAQSFRHKCSRQLYLE